MNRLTLPLRSLVALLAVALGLATAQAAEPPVVKWRQVLNDAGVAYTWDTTVDRSGDVYVCGQNALTTRVVKYSGTSGSQQWVTDLADEPGPTEVGEIRGVSVDSAGNVYLVGFRNGLFVAKLNGVTGARVWSYTRPSVPMDIYESGSEGISMRVAADGGLIILGREQFTYSYNQFDDYLRYYGILVMRLSASTGAVEWENLFTGAGTNPRPNSFASSFELDSAGNLLVAGTTEADVPNRDEGILLKFNGSTGAKIWERRDSIPTQQTGRYGVVIDSQDNAIVVGNRDFENRTLAKYSPSGSLLWENVQTGVTTVTVPEGIAIDPQGDVYVNGIPNHADQAGAQQAHVAKHSGATGAQLWRTHPDKASSIWQLISDGSGSVYAAGFSGTVPTPEAPSQSLGLLLSKFDNATGTEVIHRPYNTNELFPDTLGLRPMALQDNGDVMLAYYHISDGTGLDFATIRLGPATAPVTPHDFVITPSSEQPYVAGGPWVFTVQQEGVPLNANAALRVQYNKATINPNQWFDIAGATLNRGQDGTWTITLNKVPTGILSFRILSTVNGQTYLSDVSGIYEITGAPSAFEIGSTVASITDPTGLTTHRGGVLNYAVDYRNSGDALATSVSVVAYVPPNTTVAFKSAGGVVKPIQGSPGAAEIVWKISKLAPSESFKTLTYGLRVKEPTTAEPNVNPLGATVSTYPSIFAASGGSAAGPDRISTVGPATRIAIERLNPSQPLVPGGLVKLFFTLHNDASYNAREFVLKLNPDSGLTVQQDGANAPQFTDAQQNPLGQPKDGVSKKKVAKAPGFTTNPAFDDLPSDGQFAYLNFGTVKPGETRHAVATFRLSYDFPVDTIDSLTFEDAFLTHLSPGNNRVNETNAPLTLALSPAANPPAKPALSITTTHAAAGPAPGESADVQAITFAGLAVPNMKPARKSNQLIYTLTYRNVGPVRANFVRAVIPIPTGLVYKKGSAKVTSVKQDKIEASEPRLVDGALYFTLPYLEDSAPSKPGSEKTLQFTLTLDTGAPTGTYLDLENALVFSRELFTPGISFARLRTKVVEPARIARSLIKFPHEITPDTTAVYHTIFYQNNGGLPADNVTIEYTVPAGLTFASAYWPKKLGSHAPGAAAGRSISPITAQGKITFTLGKVAVGKFGLAEVKLTPNRSALPGANAQFPDRNLRTESDVVVRVNGSATAIRARAARLASAGMSETTTSDKFLHSCTLDTTAQIALVLSGPVYARVGDEITYKICWANRRDDVPAGIGGLEMPIPAGTEYVRMTASEKFRSNITDDAVYVPAGNGKPNRVAWSTSLEPGTIRIATVTVRVLANAAQTVDLQGVRLGLDQSGVRYGAPLRTVILGTTEPLDDAARLKIFGLSSGGASATYGTASSPGVVYLAQAKQINSDSTATTIAGADYVQLANGSIAVPLEGSRIVGAGAGNLVSIGGGNIVAAGAGNIVGAGAGNLTSFRVPSGDMLTGPGLISNLPGIVGAGAGNIVAAGAGNLVALSKLVGTDGASLIGTDGASLIGTDGASLGTFSITSKGTFFAAAGGAAALTINKSTLVGAGAGNLVSIGGGNVLATGGVPNLISKAQPILNASGTPLVSPAQLVGTDGASLVGTDGASLVGTDAASLVSIGGGNIVTSGGGLTP